MIKINYKSELKIWAAYFATIIVAVFVHELGHCIAAWCYGIKAVPTPAKTYYLGSIAPGSIDARSLGGVSGTILFSFASIALFTFSKFDLKPVLLAGALVNLAGYVLRFALQGRGHDATEFQEAQSALGASYSGHFVDWLFVSLFITGIIIWLVQSKPGLKIIPRIIIGIVVSLLVLITLQDINNKIFDPLFK